MSEDDKKLLADLVVKAACYESLARYAGKCADDEWHKVGWVTPKLIQFSYFEDVGKQGAANCRAVLRVLILSGLRQIAMSPKTISDLLKDVKMAYTPQI